MKRVGVLIAFVYLLSAATSTSKRSKPGDY